MGLIDEVEGVVAIGRITPAKSFDSAPAAFANTAHLFDIPIVIRAMSTRGRRAALGGKVRASSGTKLARAGVLLAAMCAIPICSHGQSTSTPTPITTASPTAAPAQAPTVEQLKKLKQDPVSGLRQVVIEANVSPNLPLTGKTSGVYSIQPVFPFALGKDWRVITYTILPFVQQPGQPGQPSIFGFGDTLINLFVSPRKMGSFVWGAGPTMLLPTRSNAALGPNTVALGPAVVLFFPSEKLSAGVVLQNAWSLGSGTTVDRVDAFGAQYLFNYNLSKGWYLYSNGTITSNWTADPRDRWTVPLGGGIGDVFNIDKQPVSVSLQAFGNVVTPRNGPTWSANFQFSFLFPNIGQ